VSVVVSRTLDPVAGGVFLTVCDFFGPGTPA
jgi:hypothetical protein